MTDKLAIQKMEKPELALSNKRRCMTFNYTLACAIARPAYRSVMLFTQIANTGWIFLLTSVQPSSWLLRGGRIDKSIAEHCPGL